MTQHTDHRSNDAAAQAGADRPLRTTLRLNALTSTVGGLVAAIAPGTLDRALGTGHPGWVRLVGIALVVFAADVAWLAGRGRQRLVRWTPVVIVADVAWVVGSAATIVAGWYAASGNVVVVAVALMVAGFAARQAIKLRLARDVAPG